MGPAAGRRRVARRDNAFDNASIVFGESISGVIAL